jgi:hypothetical protein
MILISIIAISKQDYMISTCHVGCDDIFSSLPVLLKANFLLAWLIIHFFTRTYTVIRKPFFLFAEQLFIKEIINNRIQEAEVGGQINFSLRIHSYAFYVSEAQIILKKQKSHSVR